MSHCHICTAYGGDASYGDGPLLECARCGVTVHAVCVGGSAFDALAPGSAWQCDYCDIAQYVKCRICGMAGGVMALAADGGLAHVTCSLWMPTAGYDPLQGVATGTATSLKDKQSDVVCMFCRHRVGAMQCASPRCLNAMHASCMAARLKSRAEASQQAIAAAALVGGPKPVVGPSHELLPAVVPVVLNLGLELFLFCPKHAAPHSGPRRQYALLRSKLAAEEEAGGGGSGGGNPGSAPGGHALSALESSLGTPGSVEQGVWDPESSSSLAFRTGAVAAPSADKDAELLRSAQEHTAFMRDVVQPYFAGEEDGASLPIHTLLGALQTHMAPVLSVTANLLDDTLARDLAGDYVGNDRYAGSSGGSGERGGSERRGSDAPVVVGYRGSTLPWQSGVTITAHEQGPLSCVPQHALPVPDDVWDSLARAVTADFRAWKGIVAHFAQGLKDWSATDGAPPPSWLISAHGRSGASGGGGGGQPARKPCCGVCMDGRETVVDEMLTCTVCARVNVHKGCYGVHDAKKASFKCDVCIHGGDGRRMNPVCCMCGNIGGPVKLTRQAQWVHVTCALLGGPVWMPLRTMSPIVVDVQQALSLQARSSAKYARLSSALHGPPSAMVDTVGGPAVWRLMQLAKQRVGMYKLPARPAPEALPNFDFTVARVPPRARRAPPTMQAPFLLAPGEVPVKCAVCGRAEGRTQACAHAGCKQSFHAMCAWLDGLYVVAASSDEGAAHPRATAVLGPLGPVLAANIFCTPHTPHHAAGRSKEQQRGLRTSQGFELRKL